MGLPPSGKTLLVLVAALACAGPLEAAGGGARPSSHLNLYGPGYAFTPRATWDREGVAWGAGVRPPEVGQADRGFGLGFSWASEQVLLHALYAGDLDTDADSLAVALGFRIHDGQDPDRFWPQGVSLSVWPFFAKSENPGALGSGDFWGGSAALGVARGRATVTLGATWMDGDALVSDHGLFASLGWRLAEDLEAFMEVGEESDALRETIAGGLVWAANEDLVVQIDYRRVDAAPGAEEDSVGIAVTLFG